MPGQTWPGAAASFVRMWVVMMVAMMLSSLVPMLWRYREAVGRTDETRLGRLTALVGVGYFFVWTVFGMAACRRTPARPGDVACASASTAATAVPA
jgi:predicted metal-binding membrane protein